MSAYPHSIQTCGVSKITSSLKIQCTEQGCRRSSFSIEQTAQGLAIVIRHKHDGEWHESKYRYDFIKNVLMEEAA